MFIFKKEKSDLLPHTVRLDFVTGRGYFATSGLICVFCVRETVVR